VARVLYSAFDVVPSPKGASTHVVQFVRGLVGAGHEVTLVTPRAPGLAADEPFEGTRMLRVGTADAGNFLARALEFGEAVADCARTLGPFDVAHFRSFWSGLPLTMLARELGFKTVFEANSLASVELPFHYPPLLASPTLEKIRRLEVETLARADAIVCVSRVTKGYLASLGAASRKIEVIPNGVDVEMFCGGPPPAIAIEGREPVLLYVGTLADWQGIGTLVEALPRILAHRPARLRVVGRGRSRQRKDLAKRVRKLGLEAHVSIEPGVPHHQVPAVIASADVCLAPLSYDERNVVQGCCPLKVLEYLACGRPVVASNLPVVRELVREGRDALLVAPDAPEALAAAVLRLLQDPDLAARLASRGQRRVREAFTWKRAQKRLLKLYEQLLAADDRGTGSVPPRSGG
jgi:glycosyltransferase involved in cell wall biosynthesis